MTQLTVTFTYLKAHALPLKIATIFNAHCLAVEQITRLLNDTTLSTRFEKKFFLKVKQHDNRKTTFSQQPKILVNNNA